MIKEHKNIYPEQPRRELSCYVLLHNNTGDKRLVNTSYVQALCHVLFLARAFI